MKSAAAALLVLTALVGCAPIPTRTLHVPAFTLILTDAVTVSRVGALYGNSNIHALAAVGIGTVFVEHGDLCALGEEVMHMAGDALGEQPMEARP